MMGKHGRLGRQVVDYELALFVTTRCALLLLCVSGIALEEKKAGGTAKVFRQVSRSKRLCPTNPGDPIREANQKV